ncbi:MAG: thermonuclease family protein [Thermomicrobiales bacterium]
MARTSRGWFSLRFLSMLLMVAVSLVSSGCGSLADELNAPTRTANMDDTFSVDGAEPHKLPKDAERMIVHKVVDGDTVQLTYPDSTRYYVTRIVGINAPESVKPNSPVECYGPEASKRLKELLPVGSIVFTERDVTDEDQYGRRLRHIWILDADTNEAFLVSEILVRGGYADAREYRPDDLFDGELSDAEKDAQQHKSGLWGAC